MRISTHYFQFLPICLIVLISSSFFNLSHLTARENPDYTSIEWTKPQPFPWVIQAQAREFYSPIPSPEPVERMYTKATEIHTQVYKTLSTDTDGDGVLDTNDLDDDNDGILDTNEGYVPCPELTATGFDIQVLDAAYHATLIKTGTDWVIAGEGLDGSGGDQTSFAYMSSIYTYPTGEIPYKVTMGGTSSLIALFTNGTFYYAGDRSNATIGNVLSNSSVGSGENWALTSLALPSGVAVGDVKTMRASGRMLMIITNSGALYVVGDNVASELDGTFSATAFTQVDMPGVITVQDAHIAQNTLFILGSDDNFYRYGTTTFDGDGSAASSITTTADLMTQPTLSGGIVQFEVGISGAYLVLDGVGNIHVMGENSAGQLGVGSTTDQLSWTNLGLTGVKVITTGRRSNLWNVCNGSSSGYIGSDDKVYLFGCNDASVITNAASNPQNAPVAASGTNADAIHLVMGGHITPYINSSLDILNTGHNQGGGFGDGTTTNRTTYSGSSLATILGGAVTVGCSPASLDTDGDGIPDYLDSDSDNDGCSDAEEGAGSFTLTGGSVLNDTLTGGVDGNGIPTAAGSTGQGLGDARNASTQTCACPFALGLDTDKDGMDNVCDIDNDNDGLPDSFECGSQTNSTSSGGKFENNIYWIVFDDTDFSDNTLNAGDKQTIVTPKGDSLIVTVESATGSNHLTTALYTSGAFYKGGYVLNSSDGYVRQSGDQTYKFSFKAFDKDDNPIDANIVATDGEAASAGGEFFELYTNVSSGWSLLENLVDGGGVYSYTISSGGLATKTIQITGTATASRSTPLLLTMATDTVRYSQTVPAGAQGLVMGWYVPDACLDTDGDGVSDETDTDSDNDAIPDLIEAGGVDTDGDGKVDDDTDTDNDGLANTFETANGSTSVLLDTNGDGTNDQDGDMDNDGLPNWKDLDADGDGILDVVEVGATDANRDGIADNSTDTDGDGLFDAYDPDADDGPGGTGTNGTALLTASTDGGDADSRPEYANGGGTGDSDGDDVPDFLDVDADNDGILDIYESQASTGYIPVSGTDSDNDGIDNAFDDNDAAYGGSGAAGTSPVNTDSGSGDTDADYLDSDSDGDGVPDMQEAWDSLDDGDSQPDGVSGSCTTDTDGDGLVDCFDSNDSDKSISTITDTPPADDGTGGATASTGVDITASNEVDTIFPNNANGDSSTEPDWRDVGNAECSTAASLYAVSDAGTAYEWNGSSGKHESGFSSGIIRATSFCEVAGGWYRFYNPLEPSNYLFAIQNGTNTTDLSTVIDYIEIEVEASPTTVQGANNGFTVMARSWKVVSKGSLNGTVNIRFYFTPTEYSDFTTAANTMTSNYVGGTLETAWFKIDTGVDYTSIPDDPASYSGVNYVDLDGSVSGSASGQADSDAGGSNKNYIQFNGLTSFSGGTFGGETSGTLPVEWLSFNAYLEGTSAQLSWETARELNNDRFEIERSIDSAPFAPVGQVRGSGTTEEISSYSFLDDKLRYTQNSQVKYRIKQVDIDGAFDYSKTIELQVIKKEELSLVIYPNPADQFIDIQYTSYGRTRQAKVLTVYDILGHELMIKELPGNLNAGETRIPLTNWEAGIYYISISNGEQMKVYKFTVR